MEIYKSLQGFGCEKKILRRRDFEKISKEMGL